MYLQLVLVVRCDLLTPPKSECQFLRAGSRNRLSLLWGGLSSRFGYCFVLLIFQPSSCLFKANQTKSPQLGLHTLLQGGRRISLSIVYS